MLRAERRLRRSADIERVRRDGRSWHHPLVIVICRRNGLPISRYAFVASRRVGKAVQRNRARRLLREAVRRHLEEMRPGWDCLMIARSPAPHALLVDVETAVLQLLGRARLLKR